MVGHGAIKITELGSKFLKQKDRIALGKYVKRGKSKFNDKPVQKDDAALFNINTSEEKALLKVLKSKRLELARAQRVPPYLIFHDRTLVEMVKRRPESIEAMSYISGVGEAKMEKYGILFLGLLRRQSIDS